MFKANFHGACAADEACYGNGRILVGDEVQYAGGDLYHFACIELALSPTGGEDTKFQGCTLEEMGF